MTSLDELIKECSTDEFYAQINTIVELAQMQESKINKLSTLQKMITQLLKSAKKKDKKQNDSEQPKIIKVIDEKLRANF